MFIEGFVVKNAEYVFTPGVIIEDLGSESAVYIPGVSEVLTLSGDAAAVIRRIRDGESVVGAEAVVSDLVVRGVIEPAQGMSRRGVVRAGVIGAGAGIAALAMPSVAAASSNVGQGGGGVSFGVFAFSSTLGGFFFSPQPVSAINEIVANGNTSVVLEVDGNAQNGTWNGEDFEVLVNDTGAFGNSVVGTWTLNTGETRTQTFLRQPDL